MAVIRDVAKLADVAVGTVSRYLKDPASIKEVNRKKIEHAIKALNYTPSPVARSMRTKKSNTIAVITPSISNPFYIEVFNSLRKHALKHSYTSILYTADDDLHGLNTYLSQLSIQPVDGIALCLLDKKKSLHSILDHDRTNIPKIIIGWEDEENPIPTVIIDVYKGIFEATNHMISTGRKRVAYISGVMDSRLYQKKYSGYTDVMQKSGLVVDKNLVYECQNNYDKAMKAAQALISEHRDIDGIVCATDVMAIACLGVLSENNISVDKIAVTGFDNIPLSHVCYPPLTTIAQPIDDIGRLAFLGLKSLIDQPELNVPSTTLDTQLIIRKSTPQKQNAPAAF